MLPRFKSSQFKYSKSFSKRMQTIAQQNKFGLNKNDIFYITRMYNVSKLCTFVQ